MAAEHRLTATRIALDTPREGGQARTLKVGDGGVVGPARPLGGIECLPGVD